MTRTASAERPAPRAARPARQMLDDLRTQLPMAAMGATGTLAMRLRDLTGRDVIDLESLQEVISLAYRVSEVAAAHRAGRYTIDEFGFDPEFTEALVPIFHLLARKYWRVETVGTENIPAHGGALLVSNHAGVLPWDGAMIKVTVFDAVERHARALVVSWFGAVPTVSWLLRRTGQTNGHPDDSLRLLRKGELVLVFPEGVRGIGKPFSERYRLRRFGRGGFVEVALRAQVPIIPVSVVGAEEIHPMLADVRPVARLLHLPFFPITPTWPLLGPLGLVPLPSRWRIRFHPMVRTDEHAAGDPDDPALVMRISDQVRDIIQRGVNDERAERGGVFRA